MADLTRFVTAQKRDYAQALEEMKQGRKRSHWMWYIFPQIDGLGSSPTAQYYAITSLQEAEDFLKDPYLGSNLKEISGVLLENPSSDASYVMGWPDNLKLRSSMTLFDEASGHREKVFRKVLDKFFGGEADERTLELIHG